MAGSHKTGGGRPVSYSRFYSFFPGWVTGRFFLMNARNKTIDYYKGSGRNFFEDVDLHLRQSGAVFVWTRRLVLMARPVFLDAEMDYIIDPHHSFDEADAWFVHFCAGDLKALAEHRNEMLRFRWISFQRGNRSSEIHTMETEKFLKHVIR